MTSRVKVALIGAGAWGAQHARILSQHEGVDFCALVGRSLQRTQARAERYNTTAYTDVSEMLRREKPDLVSVCLPNQAHYPTTLEVIQAGFPLLVEKPLVFDLAEADHLLEEAARRNLFFAINFNHRYAQPVILAREALEAQKLGETIFCSWRFGGEGTSEHPFANLIETQCHGFDLLEHLCGPIRSIMAQMTDKTNQGFSTLALALEFENGAVGTLLGSYDSSYSYPDTQRVEINGTRGRILIQDTVAQYSFQAAGSETREVWEAGYFNDEARAFSRTFDRHFDALLGAFVAAAEPPVHARAGRRALALADAASTSFREGRRVEP